MRPLSITVAIRAMAVAHTTAVIYRLDFPYPWVTETLEFIQRRTMGTQVSIQDLVAAIFNQWGIAIIHSTAGMCIAHGTTRHIWITTHLHWFLTVVIWTMFLDITTYIVQATGTYIATNFRHDSRLLTRCQQAIHTLLSVVVGPTMYRLCQYASTNSPPMHWSSMS